MEQPAGALFEGALSTRRKRAARCRAASESFPCRRVVKSRDLETFRPGRRKGRIARLVNSASPNVVKAKLPS